VTRPILFLSDFGVDDEYVGLCHAVIARVAPDARVIDLHHGVPPQDVTTGALTLAQAVAYGPDDAVFLAVVDPGVGTRRRGVAVEAGSGVLVGPDNGVLALAAEVLGGARRAVALAPGRVVPWPVSRTFHGRDVFAPAAARLAAGAALADVGDPIEIDSLSELLIGEPLVETGRVATRVIGIDRFGNVRLGARPADLEVAGIAGRDIGLALDRSTHPLRRVATYGDLEPGHAGLLEDSAGWLAVVVNGASAADALGLGRGDGVELTAHWIG
jgi:S-adenosyl-L-methionine hydrolase (adenosine-forming)